MYYDVKRVSIVPYASLGGYIHFINGGVTHLPEIEYTNKNDFPIFVFAQFTSETEEFLGNTVFMIQKFIMITPHETKKLSFEVFRGYSPIAIQFSRKEFDIDVIEFSSDSIPQNIEKDVIINNVVEENSETETEETPTDADGKPKRKRKWWKSDSTPDEDAYADKYCGGDKRTKKYKAWIAAGKPNPDESVEDEDDANAESANA